jgi:hypothetical protein
LLFGAPQVERSHERPALTCLSRNPIGPLPIVLLHNRID